MKVVEKVSWLMGPVQGNLFPHLNECLKTPLTDQEKRLVSILEIIQVERHVVKAVSRYRWPGPLCRLKCVLALISLFLSQYIRPSLFFSTFPHTYKCLQVYSLLVTIYRL